MSVFFYRNNKVLKRFLLGNCLWYRSEIFKTFEHESVLLTSNIQRAVCHSSRPAYQVKCGL